MPRAVRVLPSNLSSSHVDLLLVYSLHENDTVTQSFCGQSWVAKWLPLIFGYHDAKRTPHSEHALCDVISELLHVSVMVLAGKS